MGKKGRYLLAIDEHGVVRVRCVMGITHDVVRLEVVYHSKPVKLWRVPKRIRAALAAAQVTLQKAK